MSSSQESLLKLLKEDVLTIIGAMNKDDPVSSTQALIDMGARLQENFPTEGLDDLRKIIKKMPTVNEHWSTSLPDLRWFGILSEARIIEYGNILSNRETMSAVAYKHSIYKMDAMLKGLNIFSVLLGESRFEAELHKIHPLSEKDIENALPLINNSTYTISANIITEEKKKLLASNALQALRASLNKASTTLNQQVTEMAKAHSGLFQRYLKDGSFELELWVKLFDENKADIDASPKLLEAVAAYKAVDTLKNALNEAGTPQERLVRAQEKCHDPDLRKALSTNPDDERTALIKLLKYIAKSVLSLTIYHWVDKEESLRSPQQQFLKESLETLKSAENEHIIEPPKAKM